MRRNVPFEYLPGDAVTIVPIKEPATVVACCVSVDGHEYEVAYWYEGERRCEWLRTYELMER
jgi:hypothetical protein